MTPVYLDKNWLSATRPIWSKYLLSSTIEEAWKGIFLLADAIVEPNQSGLGDKIHSLQSFLSGNSKTNTLYFYYMLIGTSNSTTATETTSATNVSTSTIAFSMLFNSLRTNSTNSENTTKPMERTTPTSTTTTTTTTANSTAFNDVANQTVVSNKDNPVSSIDGDIGIIDARCGLALLTCFDKQGVLVSCYNKKKYQCFVGGYLCPTPWLPCIDSLSKKAVAPCYDPTKYICVGGELFFT
jgi:hypothetical protein